LPAGQWNGKQENREALAEMFGVKTVQANLSVGPGGKGPLISSQSTASKSQPAGGVKPGGVKETSHGTAEEVRSQGTEASIADRGTESVDNTLAGVNSPLAGVNSLHSTR